MSQKPPTTRRESATPEGAGSATRSARGASIDEFAGVPAQTRTALLAAGLTKREQVAEATDEDLLKLEGIGKAELKKLRAAAPQNQAADAAAGIAVKAAEGAKGALGLEPESEQQK